MVQEGDSPAEEPNALIREFGLLCDQYEELIKKINQTNIQSRIPDGRSLTEAIAERDVLKIRTALLRAAADAGMSKQARGMRTEVKFVATVNVKELRTEADALSKRHRELDSLIQATNWSADLQE